jgi:hypothetical protein
VGFNFCRRHRHCNFLKRGNGDDEREISKCEANPRQITLLIRSQEASMGKLTLAEKVREHSRGKKAAGEGRSRYWSEPWAYPFESDEHYEARRQAFEQGFDPRIQQHSED